MEECGAGGDRRTWQNERAVLWRKGGLGHYPSGEGNGWYSGDRKWRYFHTGGCGGMSGADRMRWSDAGERLCVAIRGCFIRSENIWSMATLEAKPSREEMVQMILRPRPDADRMQRGADGNAGNA